MRYVISAMVLGALALAAPASADTYSTSINVAGGGLASDMGEPTLYLKGVPGFDTTLGTLNSVGISFTGSAQYSMAANGGGYALPPSSSWATDTPVVQFSWAAFGDGYRIVSPTMLVKAGGATPTSFVDGQVYGSLYGSVPISFNTVSTYLDPYLTGQDIPAREQSMDAGAARVFDGITGKPLDFKATSFLGITEDVHIFGTYTETFDYTPFTNTPEPMSAALLGVGLLGMLAARRKIG